MPSVAFIPLEIQIYSFTIDEFLKSESGGLIIEVDLMDVEIHSPQDTALRGIAAGRWCGIASAPALETLARASALASVP